MCFLSQYQDYSVDLCFKIECLVLKSTTVIGGQDTIDEPNASIPFFVDLLGEENI